MSRLKGPPVMKLRQRRQIGGKFRKLRHRRSCGIMPPRLSRIGGELFKSGLENPGEYDADEDYEVR